MEWGSADDCEFGGGPRCIQALITIQYKEIADSCPRQLLSPLKSISDQVATEKARALQFQGEMQVGLRPILILPRFSNAVTHGQLDGLRATLVLE